MDAGGLARSGDFLTVEQFSLLPISAMRRQLEMRESYLTAHVPTLEFLLATTQIRDALALAEIKEASSRTGLIKLHLDAGTFSLLVDVEYISTCYTDARGERTSRSAKANRLALLEFARSIIELLEPQDVIKAA